MANHNDSQREEYQEQWEELDEKTILVQMLAELQQIRTLLSDADSGAQSESDDKDVYECVKCGATVQDGEKEQHARQTHSAPPGVVDELYSRV